MSKPDLMTLAEEERTELLVLLQDLTDDQWNAQSLCTRWRVREVATHIVSYDELSMPRLVGTFVRGGLRVRGVNAVALKRYAHLEPAAIIDLVSRNVRPSGLPSGFGGGIALTDGTIHHQDIRRALNVPRTIPPPSRRCASSPCSTSPLLPPPCPPKRTRKA